MRNFLIAWPLGALLGRAVKLGQLRIVDADGQSHEFGNGEPPFVTIRMCDAKLPFQLLANPSVAFGEAYMDGRLILENGNLKDFFAIVFQNGRFGAASLWQQFRGIPELWGRRFQQRNDPQKSAKNVRHHYDLSGAHYDLFLDASRQYSCAYFTGNGISLEQAQECKMELIAKKLLISPSHHVLDIGCGWGGLACYIAKKTGAQVTGITLSREQWAHAQERAEREGLQHSVKFLLKDYRHVQGPFDRIVSVGMFEHVGINHYRDFFAKAHSLLANEGVALLHSIGRASGPSYTDPWIRKYIFPGGYIPALSEVVPHAERSAFHITDIEILRSHYAHTLHEWQKRFLINRELACELHGERFCRMWEFYLAASEASFEHMGNMVFQMQLATKPGLVPITRDYLWAKDTRNLAAA